MAPRVGWVAAGLSTSMVIHKAGAKIVLEARRRCVWSLICAVFNDILLKMQLDVWQGDSKTRYNQATGGGEATSSRRRIQNRWCGNFTSMRVPATFPIHKNVFFLLSFIGNIHRPNPQYLLANHQHNLQRGWWHRHHRSKRVYWFRCS
jgi:hypothetical protein